MATITDRKLSEKYEKYKDDPKVDVFPRCECYQIKPGSSKDPENLLCYTKGCQGALNDLQDSNCKTRIIKPSSKNLITNIAKFSQIGKILKVCMPNDDIDDFYDCIEEHTPIEKKRFDSKEKKELAHLWEETRKTSAERETLYDEKGNLIPVEKRLNLSKADKIARLLKKKESPEFIANALNTSEAYVRQVKSKRKIK